MEGNPDDEQEEDVLIEDNEKTRKLMEKANRDLDRIDKKRAELNAEAEKGRATLKNAGVNVPGFNAARARAAMDPRKREVHDVSFATACNAFGVAIQPNLFDKKRVAKPGE